MAKALNDLSPIVSGFMTTVHAYTGDQMVLDGPHRKGDLRRSRAAAENIVPASSGAAKAIGLVIPELSGKLNGAAQRVPVATGSTTILDAVIKGSFTADQVNAQMKKEASESFEYNTDEIVSSDIIDSTAGSIFDATQTRVIAMEDGNTLVQVVSWYDNENSYTSQMVRTIKLSTISSIVSLSSFTPLLSTMEVSINFTPFHFCSISFLLRTGFLSILFITPSELSLYLFIFSKSSRS